jgi:lipocalin
MESGVSFFGPFYGGYHIFALDPDYRWALLARVRTAGFATDALIFPGGAAL